MQRTHVFIIGHFLCSSSSISSIEFRFSFTHIFQFPFVVSLYTRCNTEHGTRHKTHNFSLLYFHCKLSIGVCMQYSLPVCVCVCVWLCRSFTTAILLCFMLSFLLPSLCTLMHVYTRIHTSKHSLAHTHEQHAGTQRNAAPQDSVSSATTLNELQRTATGKWQLSTSQATAAPWLPFESACL